MQAHRAPATTLSHRISSCSCLHPVTSPHATPANATYPTYTCIALAYWVGCRLHGSKQSLSRGGDHRHARMALPPASTYGSTPGMHVCLYPRHARMALPPACTDGSTPMHVWLYPRRGKPVLIRALTPALNREGPVLGIQSNHSLTWAAPGGCGACCTGD